MHNTNEIFSDVTFGTMHIREINIEIQINNYYTFISIQINNYYYFYF